MNVDILFFDKGRQDEIDTFYEAAQMQRRYYRQYPKAYHQLAYFIEPAYEFQCPKEMTEVYLGFPPYHVTYKQPLLLPNTTGRTSGIPMLPDRTLAGRFNKAACKVFTR